MHRCPNRACPSRGLEIADQLGGAAADIDGVGEQIGAAAGRELGLVRSLPDLYRLRKEQLMGFDGYRERWATKVIDGDRRLRKAMPFPERPLRAQHPGRRAG